MSKRDSGSSDAHSMNETLTIFPLGTVLFPGGVLPLRIFEARYVDMVRQCMRNDLPFGVCRIIESGAAGEPVQHELLGCSTRIVNFDSEESGILSIRTIGERRFKILKKEIDSKGVIKAEVEWLEVEPDHAIPAEMFRCRDVVEQVIEELVETEDDPMKKVLEPPYLLGSASWVSHRLCEILPFAAGSKQAMLELDDALQRLSIVNQVLQKHSETLDNSKH
jgi:uncharacterized protein